MINPLRSASLFIVPAAVLLTASAATVPAAHAQTIFTANLTNAQENTPAVPTTAAGAPRPASFGTAIFTLNAAQTTLTFFATVNNIDFTGTQSADVNDNLAAAHIHAGPNAAPANNPVVWGFFGAPFNDNNPNDIVFSPFAAGVGGTISGKWDAPEGNNTTLAAQLPSIFAGRAYINFHTVQFGGGEIRGQIMPVPVTAVPEPGAVATGLALAGTLTLGIMRGRRKATA